MMYGTLFMMCGAYALAHDAHVRGDFLYGSMKPRTQATLDLALYIVFFLPGIGALTWAGWSYFQDSLRMHEQTFNATALPLYPFKFMIPVAGVIVMMQGIAEIIRCVVCLRTGQWTPRLKDAEEMDVVEQQLASSTHVDDEARRDAIERAKEGDEAEHHAQPHQRERGREAQHDHHHDEPQHREAEGGVAHRPASRPRCRAASSTSCARSMASRRASSST
jgi:TRAP-type mannitol/chloroaromatic compound transport system permease small subunit